MPLINTLDLDEDDRMCLVMASTAYEGLTNAFGIGSLDPTSFWYGVRKKREKLCNLGLLLWVDNIPSHEGDHIGWFTITAEGRNLVQRLNALTAFW